MDNITDVNLDDFYNEHQHGLSQNELQLVAKLLKKMNVDATEEKQIVITGFPIHYAMWLKENKIIK